LRVAIDPVLITTTLVVCPKTGNAQDDNQTEGSIEEARGGMIGSWAECYASKQDDQLLRLAIFVKSTNQVDAFGNVIFTEGDSVDCNLAGVVVGRQR